MTHETWRPVARPECLRLRARMKARIRAFFAQRGVLEVDTPMLSASAPTDPHIHSLATRVAGAPGPRFLHTSPEFPMKRLLAAGVGDCWQLARVFRDGERGRLHSPEFDLLEWYRLEFDHLSLMDEVHALLRAVVGPEREVAEPIFLSYREAFLNHVGVDPLEADTGSLVSVARDRGAGDIPGLEESDRDSWLDHLLTRCVIPALPVEQPVFLHSWPASQAALARLETDDPRVARRFELFWGGIELANGYHELADPREQEARFSKDLEYRRRAGLPAVPMDDRLLRALASGLPDCAGVALGFDRLVLCAAGTDHIDSVLAFPPEHA